MLRVIYEIDREVIYATTRELIIFMNGKLGCISVQLTVLTEP